MSKLTENFGLSQRIKLEQIEEHHIGIVKRIKSRIIKKDALKIIEVADTIRHSDESMKVSLICNDNICSKSITLLKENGVEVVF